MLSRVCSFRRPLLLHRTFFASSTDHTQLLKNAEIHLLTSEEGGSPTTQLVMVAQGMDLDTVKCVPQLHLARIFLDADQSRIYGAKVINRTLGDCALVCDRLVDQALERSSYVEAWATLHGLSDWAATQRGNEGLVTLAKSLASVSQKDDKDLLWQKAAMQFIEDSCSEESNLYLSKGGILDRIEYQADTTDYANTCGGSMAVFRMGQGAI